MTQRKLTLAVLFVLLFLLVGCQNMTEGIKPYSEMTPKEKASFMLAMYNKQYDNYLDAVIDPALTEPERTALKEQIKDGAGLPEDKRNPNLTDDQKQILRKKKDVLTEVYPLIDLYTSYVDSGALPSDETEQKIIGYLDSLATLVVQ